MIRPPPSSTLYPYTTLFRSQPLERGLVAQALALAPAERGRTHARVQVHERLRLEPRLADLDSQHQEEALVNLYTRVRASDRKSTRLNSSHANISYAVFCLKK